MKSNKQLKTLKQDKVELIEALSSVVVKPLSPTIFKTVKKGFGWLDDIWTQDLEDITGAPVSVTREDGHLIFKF